jgi:two-component system sensor histidine kinase BaeS
MVTVWDNGPGISSDELPHIFERFYRARHGYHKYAGGSGLGLAICKAFVEAHQSAIRVESENGRGTAFSFALPVSPGPEADLLLPAIAAPGPASTIARADERKS